MTLFDTDDLNAGGNRPKPSRKPRRKPPDPDHVPHTPEVLLRRSVRDNVDEHWSLVRKALSTPGVDLESVVNTIALAYSESNFWTIVKWCNDVGEPLPLRASGQRLAEIRMRYLLIIRDLVRAEVMDRAKREGLRLPWT